MIKCKNCGAGLRFDIDRQQLICDYCGSSVDVSGVHKADITSEEQMMEAVVHTCSQCGAEIFTTEETAATFCSYCGSSILLESRLVMVNKPDYIIPFAVSKEQAVKSYEKLLKKAIFAPSALKKAEIESIRGIYMPYWEYYMKRTDTVNARGHINEHREGSYLVSEVYNLKFKAFVESDGLEYDASSKFPDDLSQACAPFYFKESKLFNPGYMSGFYADLGDVNPDTYMKEAVETVQDVAAKEILENSNVGNYGITVSKLRSLLDFTDVKPGLAMYPVWFASARDKKGKYINYAAINGQSGKASADLPVDKKKVIIGALIFAIPIFFLLYFLITPNPHMTLVIMGVLSVIGTIIGYRKLDSMGRDDKGAGVSNKRKTKAQQSADKYEKRKMLWRMIAAIAVCVLTLFIDPVSDLFYYAAAICAGVLCGWTYLRLFELHNKGTMRPLPQLDKRGGDGK
ncbi:MAG: hypothetical protein E7233_09235 [Lachnospiraceae bacterium]|nr:hypothetical protein [Lachnospiraceae bacterium]